MGRSTSDTQLRLIVVSLFTLCVSVDHARICIRTKVRVWQRDTLALKAVAIGGEDNRDGLATSQGLLSHCMTCVETIKHIHNDDALTAG
eukprot:142556-Amphidinium_carterae.2